MSFNIILLLRIIQQTSLSLSLSNIYFSLHYFYAFNRYKVEFFYIISYLLTENAFEILYLYIKVQRFRRNFHNGHVALHVV